MPIVLKSGSLNLLESLGPVQACNGIALPFLLTPPGRGPMQNATVAQIQTILPNYPFKKVENLLLCTKFPAGRPLS